MKGFLDLLTVKFLTGFGQRPQHVWAPSAWRRLARGRGVAYLAGDWVIVGAVLPGVEECRRSSGRR